MSRKNDKNVAAALCWCLTELDMNWVERLESNSCFHECLDDQEASLEDFEGAAKVSDLMKRKDVQAALKELVSSLHGFLKETAERRAEDPDAYDPDMRT